MHSVIRRSFATLFRRRSSQLSLLTNCPSRTEGSFARREIYTELSLSLFTFSGIGNRDEVRYVLAKRVAYVIADVAGDNLTKTIRTMPSISRGPFAKTLGVNLSNMTKRNTTKTVVYAQKRRYLTRRGHAIVCVGVNVNDL